MAIVMERQYGSIKVYVCDDAYINCIPEEIKAREQEVRRVVAEIMAEPGAHDRLHAINRERYGEE